MAAASAGLLLPTQAHAQPAEPKGGEPTARIHVMAFHASDAIILESNGRFAFVDSGEDKDYPDGSDPRYPLRRGVTIGVNYEDVLWPYLDSIGVNDKNVEFYLGTHAHSDHIGLADKIIKRYKPKRIYTPEYSDEWVTDQSRLWDNQYIYDKMIAAAQEAEKDYGAKLIQHLEPGAPVVPTEDNPHTASPVFDFEGMRLEIVNYEEDYKQPPYMRDANLSAWGMIVRANGASAFLAADIENTDGDEDKIAPMIGQVDFLKLGHHGTFTSNSKGFLETLRPKMAVQTGLYEYMHDPAIQVLNQMGTRWYPAEEIKAMGLPAAVVSLTGGQARMDGMGKGVFYRSRSSASPHVTAYQGGKPLVLDGWREVSGSWYLFEDSADAVEDRWVKLPGAYHYLKPNAVMATGWTQVGKRWYHFDADGRMQHSRWLEDGGSWYYLSGSGAMVTGWLKDGGSWYYLSGSGAMVTGWLKDGGSWYYLSGSGAMVTGWLKDGGSWYYLSGSGAMVTGWLKDGGSWYYLSESGAMLTGEHKVEGRSSRFSASGAWQGYLSK